MIWTGRSAIGDDEKIRVLDVGSCYDPVKIVAQLVQRLSTF